MVNILLQRHATECWCWSDANRLQNWILTWSSAEMIIEKERGKGPKSFIENGPHCTFTQYANDLHIGVWINYVGFQFVSFLLRNITDNHDMHAHVVWKTAAKKCSQHNKNACELFYQSGNCAVEPRLYRSIRDAWGGCTSWNFGFLHINPMKFGSRTTFIIKMTLSRHFPFVWGVHPLKYRSNYCTGPWRISNWTQSMHGFYAIKPIYVYFHLMPSHFCIFIWLSHLAVSTWRCRFCTARPFKIAFP